VEGRLTFRVYNPMKAIKYGIKSYVLADSVTSYCWNILVYDGQARTIHDIIFHIMDRLTGQFYSLYMDNVYNSVHLSIDLLNSDTYVCGTLRRNRGEPQVIREAGIAGHALRKGDTVVRSNGRVLIFAWQDNRTVRAISTKHSDEMRDVRVSQRGGDILVVIKQVCITDYNKYMNGVDRIDQMIQYYPTVRKTIKWTKKRVLYFLELSVHNASVIYNDKHDDDKLSLFDFQMSVVKGLCKQSSDDSDSDSDEAPAPPPGRVVCARKDPVDRLDGGFKVHTMPASLVLQAGKVLSL
jgi:hypothetical protein